MSVSVSFAPDILDMDNTGVETAVVSAASAALEYERTCGEISVFITGDAEIRGLNRDYRGIDAPTDVLSFPSCDGDALPGIPDGFLGDIAISLDTAVRQADEFGHSLLRELSFLAVHGTLHLLGYDHIEEDDRMAMFARQTEILEDMRITR